MRYPASEKLEIIRTVEQSSLGVRRTLQQVGIPRSTFYNWYDRYVSEGFDGLEDKKPDPGPVWNKVPEDIAQQLVRFALAEPDLSPRELAVRFTEERRYYLSESTVYRVLKSHDLITAPAFIVLQAAERFAHPTTAVNQLWQTDFTYLKVMGWGWLYLSTVLDDFSRYIIAWRLCNTMSARDVSATPGCLASYRPGPRGRPAQTSPAERQRAVLRLVRTAVMAGRKRCAAYSRQTLSPHDAGQDRTLAPDSERPHPAQQLLPA